MNNMNDNAVSKAAKYEKFFFEKTRVTRISRKESDIQFFILWYIEYCCLFTSYFGGHLLHSY